jgi:tetratricopeptide (TPR) repeat protein
MELVDGVPITQAADTRGLNVAQRLAWFSRLCRTIEAAHTALIVHRDLKPSNLFVTSEGDLKVLDFGIAKLVDNDEHTTRTLSIALTPEYAAPEQYGPTPLTTAVDVYALGVVLGELLTGIRLTGSVRASRAVAAAVDADSLPRGLPQRSALARLLSGDLDAILAGALADEPAMRYSSAGAFADDVERYLSGRPVRVHPPSRLYRAQKFVRRHRGAVAATVMLVVAILASLGIVAWQAHSIAREAQRAESTRDFLLRVFSAAEPAGPRLGPPTVADVVRASISEAQHSASLQPAVRVELIDALGGVLRKQGDTRNSLQLLEDNYRSAVATLGASDPATLLAGLGLAQSRIEAGLHASARLLIDDLIDKARHAAGIELQARLLSISAFLGTERFERERAFAESEAAVALCAHGCDDRTHIETLVTRGSVLSVFHDEPAAIPVLEQAVELQRTMFGGPHIETADTIEALSRAYRRTGQLDRAESLARESLAIVETSLPDPHQRRSSALDSLRQVLIDSRKFDEAIALGLRVIAMDEAARGPGHPTLATDRNTLGFTYMLHGDYTEAAAQFRAALAIAETIPDNDRRSAIYQADLGYSIGLAGDFAEGKRLIQIALSRFRAQAEVDYSEVSSALEKFGDLARRSGEFDSALATYRESDNIYRTRLQTGPTEWHARTLIGLGRTLSAGHDDVRAETALRQAIAKMTAPATRLSPLRVEAKAALAEILMRNGNTLEARRLLQGASSEAKLAPGTLPSDIQALLRDATGLIRIDRT